MADGTANGGASAGTPLLVLVHGTGRQAHDENEVYLQANHDPADDPCSSDLGEQWWQTDGGFCRALAARIATRDGRRLDVNGQIVRLKWTGDNLESARDWAAFHFGLLVKAVAPRRVHVIAHSHGGNVVRAGVEDLAREGWDLAQIGGVVSMGTPFFTYSRRRVRTTALVLAIRGGVAALTAYWATRLFVAEGEFAAKPWWAWALAPAAALAGLTALWSLVEANHRWRKPARGTAPAGPRAVRWTNLCSRTDEAIQLLRALDRPVRLFGRFGEERGGMLWAGLVGTMIISVFTVTVSALDHLKLRSQWVEITISGAATLAMWLLYLAMRTVRAGAMTLGAQALDAVVARRVRTLAFGDDEAAGITGVSTEPWTDRPGAHRALPEAIEDAIEQRIAQSTAGLWAKARGAIRPDASFLDADVRYLIDEVLTGDELSHTVYYRVDAFIDLVAELLVETGDYVRLEPGQAA